MHAKTWRVEKRAHSPSLCSRRYHRDFRRVSRQRALPKGFRRYCACTCASDCPSSRTDPSSSYPRTRGHTLIKNKPLFLPVSLPQIHENTRKDKKASTSTAPAIWRSQLRLNSILDDFLYLRHRVRVCICAFLHVTVEQIAAITNDVATRRFAGLNTVVGIF
jgi:hypothetical protein